MVLRTRYRMIGSSSSSSIQARDLNFHRLLDDSIFDRASVPIRDWFFCTFARIRIGGGINRRIPIAPSQKSHSRIQHRNHTTCDQIYADGTVGVAIEGFSRIFGIALQPDMVVRDNLGWSWTRLASSNSVTGKGNNSLDCYIWRIRRWSFPSDNVWIRQPSIVNRKTMKRNLTWMWQPCLFQVPSSYSTAIQSPTATN
jgi:hypothetical protein